MKRSSPQRMYFRYKQIHHQISSSTTCAFNPFLGTLLPQTQRVLMVVTGSQELQGILNSTLNYNSTMKLGQNITISLVSGNQTISATVRSGYTPTYNEPIAPHTFDIQPTGCFGSISALPTQKAIPCAGSSTSYCMGILSIMHGSM